MEQIKATFEDNCGGPVSVSMEYGGNLVACTYTEGVGYNYSYTANFRIWDGCGNSTPCAVSFTAACICTYTQGFWGNANGKADGLKTSQILDTLMKYGPVKVGDGTNCGFALATPACVLGILPAGGPSNPLEKNYALNCNKKIKNTLVGQLVAMKLNIRYNAHFREIHLDSLVLTGDCALAPELLNKLGLGDTSTVGELIALADSFLASNCTGAKFPKSFGSALTNALGGLNEFWDECQVDTPCVAAGQLRTTAERQPDALPEERFQDIELAPNPANATLNIRFESTDAGRAYLYFYDSGTRLVKSLPQDVSAGENRLTIDVSGFSPGLYWLRLANGQSAVTKRFVIYRD